MLLIGALPLPLLYPSASDFQFRYAPMTVGLGRAAYRNNPSVSLLMQIYTLFIYEGKNIQDRTNKRVQTITQNIDKVKGCKSSRRKTK